MSERLIFTFALTGRREWGHGTQGVALGYGLAGLSARAGPHNRLLRRQHCSSLCSQSEGHEHVANMASALGHDFVGFLAVYSRHNIRSPHFACKVSYSAAPQPSPNVRAAPLVAMSLRYLTKNIAEFL